MSTTPTTHSPRKNQQKKRAPLSPARFLLWFFSAAALLLAALALIVFCFDPFFHYHKPWFGLSAVLTDKEYQCIGTLRTFDYDSLIVGSSVVENNDNSWYDDAFDTTAIKAVRSYGATADLCYLLDAAHESHTLDYVFYNIDPSSLAADPVTTYASTGCPMYLYDTNPLNDYQYWFNKDVLFEKIPYMILKSLTGYNEGESYNWAQWKTFSASSILSNYARSPEITPMMSETVYAEQLAGNLALLEAEVSSHPETQYYFFFPPYSILWWDAVERSGELESYLYNEEQAMRLLLSYDNVRLFTFQDREDMTANLDNYLDTLHFSPEINRQMCEAMAAGENEVTQDTIDETIASLRAYTDRVLTEYIPALEDEFHYAESTSGSDAS
ncbi:MAG: SGNH/GDSL hydrolase family protein [Eubacteriales bacterium]|nr:SGNH/GDSL hydrolase family protein [Eubacteriales bacterium]